MLCYQWTSRHYSEFTYSQLHAILRHAKKWPGIPVMQVSPAAQTDKIFIEK